MTFSKLEITDKNDIAHTINFRADERYSLSWGLINLEESARPEGQAAFLISAGQSLTSVDVSGSLLNDTIGSQGSAEKQLWDDLLTAARDGMGSKDGDDVKIKATLTLVSINGTVVMSGWLRNFLTDADAPQSAEEIKFTLNFLLEVAPTVNLT